jgi:2-aminobenzoate-CoA ligase
LPPLPPVATGRDDPALIAFTSGTTGEPKGCIQFHRDVLAPCDTFAKHLVGPKPGDIFLTSAPMAFTFGLGITLLFPLRFGAAAATIEQSSPPTVLDAIAKFGVTHLGTAPTAYKAMLSQPNLDAVLKTLRYCISAGEHLPEASWRAWEDRTGIAITDGIGSTEMMHIFVSAAGDDIRPGSTGKAVPGYRATILDADGNEIEEGVGRLAIKGPTGCRYLDDPRQRDYVENSWNVTGDTYRRDADGYYWYLARSDDMIVSSGYNIGAPEVENALLSHPAVAECAVIGVPCTERGQKVKAFVVLSADALGSDALITELQAHVKAEIAPYKYPREIEFVEALPKTATGKLRRSELRARP